MAVSIPTHSEWKKFKEKHGVEANAVSSVNVGKALDEFHKAFSRDFKKNAVASSECYKALSTYLNKFPDKKAKDAKKFKAEFEKGYVKMASAATEEFSTMAGNLKTFGGRVVLLMTEAAKLVEGTGLDTLQKFRSGPVRGMLAAAKQVKGFDPGSLEKLWSPIDTGINDLDKDSSEDTLKSMVKTCQLTAKATLKVGKDEGLF